MNIIARFQRALFLTVGLAILSYVVAEKSITMALFALPVWAASWLITQGRTGRPLPRAIIAALVFVATVQVFTVVLRNPDDLVIGVSRYLVWLHLIKLYDRVTPRDQGQLIIMSLFLAIGAALTSNSIWLGLVLMLYAPAVLWTSVLHQIASGLQRQQEMQSNLRPRDRRQRTSDAAKPDSTRGLLWTAALAGVGISLLATGVFIITPRSLGQGVLGDWPDPSAATSGFTDEVNLGEEGLISESHTPVLDVKITDADGENAISKFNSRLLLRGAVLDDYRDGRWTRSRESTRGQYSISLQRDRWMKLLDPVPDAPVYELSLTYRNKSDLPLFSLFRPVRVRVSQPAQSRFDPENFILELDATGRVSCRIEVQPDGALVGRTATVSPRLRPIFREGPIHDLATTLMEQRGLSRDAEERYTPDDERIARLFSDMLHTSYAYTLEMTAPAPGVDPIEMFLFDTRRGHCEYFASALAALCRSVGIDARVVTGYVAVEEESLGDTIVVRESNAHAWCEVRTSPGQWITLDPSPPADIARIHEPDQGVLAGLRSMFESIERIWVSAIVAYDDSRRLEIMGQPPAAVANLADRHADGVMPFLTVRRLLARIGDSLATGLAVFITLGVAGLAVSHLVKYLARRRARTGDLQQKQKIDPAYTDRVRQAAFFKEAVTLLRRAGFQRPDWQPPATHARSLASHDQALSETVTTLADLYYRSRFGKMILNPEQLSCAQQALQDLRARLAQHETHPGQPRYS